VADMPTYGQHGIPSCLGCRSGAKSDTSLADEVFKRSLIQVASITALLMKGQTTAELPLSPQLNRIE
jgi:hypothetical protein